jgi:hypothetical protein
VTDELIEARHPGVMDNKHLQGLTGEKKVGCLALLIVALSAGVVLVLANLTA